MLAPEQVTTETVQTRIGPVEFADAGSGLPVLYFHGTGAGGDAALVTERRLLHDGFRLIVPNRPGYYATPLRCGRSSADCADLAQQLLDHLGVARAAVVGTSGGGPPAASFAKRHPERTACLVLQCAQAHRWDEGRWLPQGLGRALPLFRSRPLRPFLRLYNRLHYLWLQRRAAGGLKAMSGARFADLCHDPGACAMVTSLMDSCVRCSCRPGGIENDWDVLLSESWIEPGWVRPPTLVIHDRADPLVPFVHAEWAFAASPTPSCARSAPAAT